MLTNHEKQKKLADLFSLAKRATMQTYHVVIPARCGVRGRIDGRAEVAGGGEDAAGARMGGMARAAWLGAAAGLLNPRFRSHAGGPRWGLRRSVLTIARAVSLAGSKYLPAVLLDGEKKRFRV